MRMEFEPELMGVLGLSWQEKMASDLFNIYADPDLKAGIFGSIFSASPWNTAYINQIESVYKDGVSQGMGGSDLSAYILGKITMKYPAMADSYIRLRGGVSGGSFENVLKSVVNPITEATGSVVKSVSEPLTMPLIIIAGIAAIGLIGYLQYKKH
jgi:hypothetical protein